MYDFLSLYLIWPSIFLKVHDKHIDGNENVWKVRVWKLWVVTATTASTPIIQNSSKDWPDGITRLTASFSPSKIHTIFSMLAKMLPHHAASIWIGDAAKLLQQSSNWTVEVYVACLAIVPLYITFFSPPKFKMKHNNTDCLYICNVQARGTEMSSLE